MRYLLPLLLLLGGCGGCASVPSHADLRATAVRMQAADGSVCAGTAIAADTFATTKHCIEDSPVRAVNSSLVKVTGIGRNSGDVVTVRVTGVRFKTWAKFGPPLAQGDRVRWFGVPRGVPMYREGYVTLSQTDIVLIDAPSFSGDSGSGVFDAQGRLVGVVYGGLLWKSELGHHLQMTVMYPPER